MFKSLFCHYPQKIESFYIKTYEERTGRSVSAETVTMLSSLATAIFIPGGFLGAIMGGFLADRLGR